MKSHTKTYESIANGEFTKITHLPGTFGGNFEDVCQRVTRSRYLSILNNRGVHCSGDWCIDGEFSCKGYPCYEMEHIIDLKHSLGFNEHDMEILGNVIMAYSVWNREMGHLKWENVENEKRAVYGNNIVDRAMQNIIKCRDARLGIDPDFIAHNTTYSSSEARDTLDQDYSLDPFSSSEYDIKLVMSFSVGMVSGCVISILGVILISILIILYRKLKSMANNVEYQLNEEFVENTSV